MASDAREPGKLPPIAFRPTTTEVDILTTWAESHRDYHGEAASLSDALRAAIVELDRKAKKIAADRDRRKHYRAADALIRRAQAELYAKREARHA